MITRALSVLQGDTLPSTPCAVASIDLVNTNDECSRTIESLFTGISGEFTRLYSGDCPTRLLNYASVCSNAHGEGVRICKCELLCNVCHYSLQYSDCLCMNYCKILCNCS